MEVKFPVNCLAVHRDHDGEVVVLGGGGGPGRTGLKNTLLVLKFSEDVQKGEADHEAAPLVKVAEHVFDNKEDAPWSVAVHPKGTDIAAGVNEPAKTVPNNNCRLLKLSGETLSQELKLNTVSSERDDFQCAAEYSLDGTALATGSDSGRLSVYSTGAFIQKDWSPIKFKSKIYDLAFTPDSANLIVTSADVLQIVRVADGDVRFEAKPPKGHTFRAAKLGKGSLLYTVVNQRREKSMLSVWDLNNPKHPVKTITIGAKPAVSFALQKTIVAVGLADCSIIVFRQLRRLQVIPDAHDVPITSLAIVRRGTRVLSATSDGHVKLWPVRPAGAAVRGPRPGPIGIALMMAVLLLLIVWLSLPPQLLHSLNLPYLVFEKGAARIVVDHVPALKKLGLDQILG